MIKDPVKLLSELHNPDFSRIKEIYPGKKYLFVIADNGNIGIAANIINIEKIDAEILKTGNTEDIRFRLIAVAYLNSIINTNKEIYENKDLFEITDFSKYKRTVMIGYSEPMYKKLKAVKNTPAVFDLSVKNQIVKKQNMINSFLKNADSLILTGTAVINNTFTDILRNTSGNCDIFLTGPSVTLSEDILKNYGLKGIFGTIFSENKSKITELIKEGKGTNFLKKYGKKVALLK